MGKNQLLLLLHFIFFIKLISLQPISTTEFIFNTFNSSNLTLHGATTLDEEHNILTLTNNSAFTMGRAFYTSKVPTRTPNTSKIISFYTSFIFSMTPVKGSFPGHGLVFLFSPFATIEGGSSAQNLGLFNRTNDGNEDNHVLGVEFDVFENPVFSDIDENHVGVDVNSLTSVVARSAGYWDDVKVDKFKSLKLNNGVNYQVWIDYQDSLLNVTMAVAGMTRPKKPLISDSLNLCDVFLDEMYVGFSAATGQLVETHRILAWGFSNTDFLVGDRLVTSNLPSFLPPGTSVFATKRFIIGMSVAIVLFICCALLICVLLIKRRRKMKRDLEAMEEWELEYWPHRITYQEVYTATKGFSDENIIGVGGNGKVYKGVLVGGVEVAVKRISHETEEGMREFLAEVSSLGRLKHRNLVGFRGWCKRERGSLILIYDYMEYGSLDKWVFECDESVMLGWKDRVRVLKNVAAGVLYLHEGWESRVLHRDIKASNVLLDRDMRGRLGDFGLARMHGHGLAAGTTRVVGTAGRPIEEGKPPLVDWIWGLMEKGELVNALDENLKAKGGFDSDEVEWVLRLGLLCAYPDPGTRPTMRQVLKVLDRTPSTDESEGDLLEKMKSSTMWSKYRRGSHKGAHPTFEQIRQSISSSMSLSGSDIIMEGR
ncbi:hypothetical protein IFM89_028724 [Coptis chinensis]|uniref:non-specific serine/threonine protein kinase n=1 Tax=Coptis chinensis TaxID=261450 RepID=A0A835GZV3_9MAGN|nr:hypothetical protein IFM89_028724 [Coptis chinensis]